jgi:hypothetical protein
MNTRKTLLAIAFAGSALAVPLAAHAAVAVDIDIAPPAPRYEAAPPRAGYVYAPGYYRWDEGHHQHVWVAGEYLRERPGEHWVPNRWTEHNGRYHFDEGRWERDKGQ